MELSPAAVLYDANGNPLAFADGSDVSSAQSILIAGKDAEDKSRIIFTEGNGVLRVASVPPSPPPGTTEFVLAPDNGDLEVGPTPTYHEKESSVIGNGTDLVLQFIAAGAEGDPSERGSKVEIFWREGAGPTDHLVERMYLTGATVALSLPDTRKTRDGTTMTGNGSNTKLVIKRTRMSTSAQEVDCVVRGYTE
jgi:hypothetical protein